MLLARHLAEPGWPQFERDPEVPDEDYDTWTWKTPPWLADGITPEGFHVRNVCAADGSIKPQLYLQRSAAPRYLCPPIAYWLDLVNYDPLLIDGILRLENIETKEVIRVHPADMYL